MPRKPNPKWDDPDQSQRFLDTAKTTEASEDPKDFERALIKVASRKSSRPKAPGVN
jgi:hypothetical protein